MLSADPGVFWQVSGTNLLERFPDLQTYVLKSLTYYR